MRMTKESQEKMNNLATLCFDANAVIDNLAYNLAYLYYNNIEDIVHHNVAHVMPLWADEITEEMLLLSVRPVRGDIKGYNEEYKNLNDIFEKMYEVMINMRNACRNMIESADLDDDDEVRIFGESFLERNISPFIKQAEEWVKAANSMDPYKLDEHIKDHTHFIAH